MLYKNLTLAWRQIVRQCKLSFLQIIGITIGVSASLLLSSYINWHYSFDKSHLGYQHTYRVLTLQQEGDVREENALSPAGLAPLITEQITGIQASTRIAQWIANDVVISQDNKVIRDDQIIFAEPSFFTLFSFQLISGSSASLTEPNYILITQSRAKALFGEIDPLGKEVLFENFKPLQVAGIVEDPPLNSHIQYSSIISLKTLQNWGLDIFNDDQMDIPYVYTYLKLKDGIDAKHIGDLMTSFVSRNRASHESKTKVSFQLMSLGDLHLFANQLNDIIPSGQGNSIWILFGISVLILVISWVNHINIFTASAMQQKKSLDTRKVIGAQSGEIFRILFTQSILLGIIGVIAGLVIASLLHQSLFDFFNMPVHRSILSWFRWQPSIILLIIIFSGTLVSSFLPAFWIANQRANILITPQVKSKLGGMQLRLYLVGLQFAIILTLIVCGLVVYQQTSFVFRKDPGILLDHVLAIRSPLGFRAEHFDQKYSAFQQQLLSHPFIQQVAFSRDIPGQALEYTGTVSIDQTVFPFGFYRNLIEPDLLSVYEVPILAQTEKTFLNNGRYAFVNRQVLDLLGISDPTNILNKSIEVYGWDIEIVGAIENFHQQSLHHPVVPMMLDFSGGSQASVDGYISIRYDDNANLAKLDEWINEIFTDFFPLTVYESTHVKDHYYDQYRWDDNFQKISIGFTLVGLLTGCLGLLALSILLMQKRLKEVCIRKLLGASLVNILLLFVKDFMLVILVAMPFAFISAFILLNKWLENYAFHIGISWWVYLLAGGITLIVGFITISTQIFQISKVNPVDRLRES